MKKIFALLLMAVMSVTLLAGCGTDPVYEDLSNFLNVEMVEVNAEYEKLTAEVGTWETLEDDAAIKKSIDDNALFFHRYFYIFNLAVSKGILELFIFKTAEKVGEFVTHYTFFSV